MNMPLPPSTPQIPIVVKSNKNKIVYLAAFILGGPIGLCLFVIAFLRALGLIQPFVVPTDAMSPTIAPGDHIVMEKLTYLRSKPQRGDLIVFRTHEIPALHQDTTYLKRLVGLPGDELYLRNGHIYVNGKQTSFKGKNGDIQYVHFPQGRFLTSDNDPVFVPANKYFVLGDNSRSSADSRLWGFLPEQSVFGRCIVCDWPPSHVGFLK